MNNDLEQLRKKIDEIDNSILNLLSKRMQVVRKIGLFKKENNLAIINEKRWQEKIESIVSKAKILNISEDFLKNIFKLIHDYSVKAQEEIK